MGAARRELDYMNPTNGYEPSTLQFRKYNNENCNRRGKTEYVASVFLPFGGKHPPRLPDYKGTIFDDQLEFDSSYESANLMAVYKVPPRRFRSTVTHTTSCSRTTPTPVVLRSGSTSK
jgi:hypothetical protein